LIEKYQEGEISGEELAEGIGEEAGGVIADIALTKGGGKVGGAVKRSAGKAVARVAGEAKEWIGRGLKGLKQEARAAAREGLEIGRDFGRGFGGRKQGVYLGSVEGALQEGLERIGSGLDEVRSGRAARRGAGETHPNLSGKVTDVEDAFIGGGKGGKTIGLGFDERLPYLRQQGAYTYEIWHRAGLTKVPDWKYNLERSYFYRAFRESAENASGILFDIHKMKKDVFYLNRHKGFSRHNYTNAELHYILRNPEWLKKTRFIDRGRPMRWNGDWFEPIPE
jgi:hypothetical protein